MLLRKKHARLHGDFVASKPCPPKTFPVGRIQTGPGQHCKLASLGGAFLTNRWALSWLAWRFHYHVLSSDWLLSIFCWTRRRSYTSGASQISHRVVHFHTSESRAATEPQARKHGARYEAAPPDGSNHLHPVPVDNAYSHRRALTQGDVAGASATS